MQGYHTGGLPLAFTGMLKGVVGIAVRPTVGILELVSKGTQGMGLVFLGREAITGSAQRRVRAPGALAEEQTEVQLPSHEPLVTSPFRVSLQGFSLLAQQECHWLLTILL